MPSQPPSPLDLKASGSKTLLADRARYGKRSALLAIAINCFLASSKYVLGLWTHSVAIQGDALNNFSDMLSSWVVLFGFHLAGRAADPEHPYGHARAEYFASSILAVFILLAAFEQGKSSVEAWLHPATSVQHPWLWPILIMAILLKVLLLFYQRYWGKRLSSELLMASSVDATGDVLATTLILLGSLLGPYLSFNLDAILGFFLALFIAWSGLGILRDTANAILGIAPDKELVERVKALVTSDPLVLDTHDLLVHSYGVGQNFATIHVVMDADLNLLEAHEHIDALEIQAEKTLGLKLLIHLDPKDQDSPRQQNVEEVVRDEIHRLDPDLCLHDFRIVEPVEQRTMRFELHAPLSWQGDLEAVGHELQIRLYQRFPGWQIDMQLDRAYSDL